MLLGSTVAPTLLFGATGSLVGAVRAGLRHSLWRGMKQHDSSPAEVLQTGQHLVILLFEQVHSLQLADQTLPLVRPATKPSTHSKPRIQTNIMLTIMTPFPALDGPIKGSSKHSTNNRSPPCEIMKCFPFVSHADQR